ncbi:hypothetical protein [Campylobacter devanensis]|uniref:hypothetical protein n=1 Tax=Campylobacter devanensis TaxID=3161138 RepID=UPI000A35966E|nr:hypothetical protein [Campylobacter sp. P0209]
MNAIQTLADGWLSPSPSDLQEQYAISKPAQAILRLKKRQESDRFPLPFTKIGKRILYKREQIENWLLANQNGNI